MPIEVENEHRQRALHHAAGSNALRVARLLIERGAEVDQLETAYGATPIGWAAHGDDVEMVDLLSRFSRNVWTLSFRGYVDRLRDVLQSQPELARIADDDGITPLWWLPDDEAKALEIVGLFLSHGADPSIRNKQGRTAADCALNRAMSAVARRLGVLGVSQLEPSPPPPDLAKYEALARDLLFAFESNVTASMQRLQEHFGGSITWEALRQEVRRRLDNLPESEKPAGYFSLDHARLLIARGAGFENWTALMTSQQEARDQDHREQEDTRLGGSLGSG